MTIRDLQKPRSGRAIALWAAIGLIAATAGPVYAQAGGAQPGAKGAAGEALAYRQADQAVRELVQLTDVSQLRNVFTDQFIGRVEGALSMFGGTLDPQTMDMVAEQTRAVVSERIADGDALYSVLAPIYEKHFNLIELNQLVSFYESPLGQKLVRISPQLLTESLDLGQEWGMSLVPEIVSRVRARMNGASAASLAAPSAQGQTSPESMD